MTICGISVTGVLNAADYYSLEELRQACVAFLQCCITVDTVCPLLSTADRYVQYKCTKSMLQKVGVFFVKIANVNAYCRILKFKRL